MDTLAYVLALEEICKVDASHGTIMSVNNSLFNYGLLKFGTEQQKQDFLIPVASGEKIGAYSLTEPMSGSDASTMRSRAVRDGDDYIINGRKSWVTSGPVADFVLLFTITAPDQGYRGITAVSKSLHKCWAGKNPYCFKKESLSLFSHFVNPKFSFLYTSAVEILNPG